MNKYSVEHNGKTYSRNSSRVYTHAAVWTGVDYVGDEVTDISWASNSDLARKAGMRLQQFRNNGSFVVLEIQA